MVKKEYIDLEEAVATLKHNSLKCFNSYYKGYVNAIKDLADIPPAIVAPVRHGQWFYSYETTTEVKMYICSECRSERAIDKYDNIEEYRYCPNCGAKLDKED